MNVERRDFIKYLGAGAVAATIRPSLSTDADPQSGPEQKIHQDYLSNILDLEYFMLGNGELIMALQSSPKPDHGTHCGLLLWSAEHFCRKMSTYLYHPERGLQNSRFTLAVEGKGYAPDHGLAKMHWEYSENIPTIVIEWKAGSCSVREELICPVNDAAVLRTVTVTNTGSAPATPVGTILLYPNLMYFDEYHVDRENLMLTASGYQTLRMFSPQATMVGDRHLSVGFGELAAGASKSATIVLTLNLAREKLEKKGFARLRKEARLYWEQRARFDSDNTNLNHLFAVSRTGLRTAVANSGKMDAGIWQYNLEWVRDHSMIVVGSVLAGHHDIVEPSLQRMLARSVDESGRAIDASRHRPPQTIELDQNGELLYALWTHWVWSGDDSMIKLHWPKIKAVANYPLKPEFLDPATGMVKNSREYWERDPGFGVKEGYELAYQTWNIIGWKLAAEMAVHMGEPESARRWVQASERMKQSFLYHPTLSFVDDGKLIKRRLLNGEVQRTFEPPNRKSMPPGVPLNIEQVSYTDPDSASVLPLMYDVVDAKSPLGNKTLESMEFLWNQRWTMGGYARYNITSEPDSPGPWPFATVFMARSYFEANNDEKVWRALNWLLEVPGGKAGSWLECFVERPTPPLPPLGIVVWTWAELVMFFVHHLLGVRPNPKNLMIRPRLLSGMQEARAKVIVHGREVNIDIRRAKNEKTAFVNGKAVLFKDGAIVLPLPKRNLSIEIHS
ncbi:MAG: twin-arginine translocation signal domain-containing protein [bacterium]